MTLKGENRYIRTNIPHPVILSERKWYNEIIYIDNDRLNDLLALKF